MNQFNNNQGGFGGGFNNQQQQPQQQFNQQQQPQNNGFNNQQQFNQQPQGYNAQQNQYNQQQGYNPQNAGFPDMQIDDNATPSAGFGDLPKGIYPVRITNAEYKPNKSQTGFVLSLEHTVIAGTFAGRKIFDHLNLQHSNEQTQNIAQSNYAKLCQSIGCPRHRNPGLLLQAEYAIDYGPRRKKQNDNVYGEPEQEAPEMEVKDRLPLSAAHGSSQPQQQAMPMSQPQQQQQAPQQQYNQQPQQQQFNQQQQPQQQQGFNQQQQQQPQQQFNQQQQGGFPGNDANNGQQQQAQQQPGNLQQAQQQGQNGNSQGNDPVQNSFGANGNPGNMNGGSPFNNGGGQGFGSM